MEVAESIRALRPKQSRSQYQRDVRSIRHLRQFDKSKFTLRKVRNRPSRDCLVARKYQSGESSASRAKPRLLRELLICLRISMFDAQNVNRSLKELTSGRWQTAGLRNPSNEVESLGIAKQFA
jgi:hypothetical protein